MDFDQRQNFIQFNSIHEFVFGFFYHLRDLSRRENANILTTVVYTTVNLVQVLLLLLQVIPFLVMSTSVFSCGGGPINCIFGVIIFPLRSIAYDTKVRAGLALIIIWISLIALFVSWVMIAIGMRKREFHYKWPTIVAFIFISTIFSAYFTDVVTVLLSVLSCDSAVELLGIHDWVCGGWAEGLLMAASCLALPLVLCLGHLTSLLHDKLDLTPALSGVSIHGRVDVLVLWYRVYLIAKSVLVVSTREAHYVEIVSNAVTILVTGFITVSQLITAPMTSDFDNRLRGTSYGVQFGIAISIIIFDINSNAGYGEMRSLTHALLGSIFGGIACIMGPWRRRALGNNMKKDINVMSTLYDAQYVVSLIAMIYDDSNGGINANNDEKAGGQSSGRNLGLNSSFNGANIGALSANMSLRDIGGELLGNMTMYGGGGVTAANAQAEVQLNSYKTGLSFSSIRKSLLFATDIEVMLRSLSHEWHELSGTQQAIAKAAVAQLFLSLFQQSHVDGFYYIWFSLFSKKFLGGDTANFRFLKLAMESSKHWDVHYMCYCYNRSTEFSRMAENIRASGATGRNVNHSKRQSAISDALQFRKLSDKVNGLMKESQQLLRRLQKTIVHQGDLSAAFNIAAERIANLRRKKMEAKGLIFSDEDDEELRVVIAQQAQRAASIELHMLMKQTLTKIMECEQVCNGLKKRFPHNIEAKQISFLFISSFYREETVLERDPDGANDVDDDDETSFGGSIAGSMNGSSRRSFSGFHAAISLSAAAAGKKVALLKEAGAKVAKTLLAVRWSTVSGLLVVCLLLLLISFISVIQSSAVTDRLGVFIDSDQLFTVWPSTCHTIRRNAAAVETLDLTYFTPVSTAAITAAATLNTNAAVDTTGSVAGPACNTLLTDLLASDSLGSTAEIPVYCAVYYPSDGTLITVMMQSGVLSSAVVSSSAAPPNWFTQNSTASSLSTAGLHTRILGSDSYDRSVIVPVVWTSSNHGALCVYQPSTTLDSLVNDLSNRILNFETELLNSLNEILAVAKDNSVTSVLRAVAQTKFQSVVVSASLVVSTSEVTLQESLVTFLNSLQEIKTRFAALDSTAMEANQSVRQAFEVCSCGTVKDSTDELIKQQTLYLNSQVNSAAAVILICAGVALFVLLLSCMGVLFFVKSSIREMDSTVENPLTVRVIDLIPVSERRNVLRPRNQKKKKTSDGWGFGGSSRNQSKIASSPRRDAESLMDVSHMRNYQLMNQNNQIIHFNNTNVDGSYLQPYQQNQNIHQLGPNHADSPSPLSPDAFAVGMNQHNPGFNNFNMSTNNNGSVTLNTSQHEDNTTVEVWPQQPDQIINSNPSRFQQNANKKVFMTVQSSSISYPHTQQSVLINNLNTSMSQQQNVFGQNNNLNMNLDSSFNINNGYSPPSLNNPNYNKNMPISNPSPNANPQQSAFKYNNYSGSQFMASGQQSDIIDTSQMEDDELSRSMGSINAIGAFNNTSSRRNFANARQSAFSISARVSRRSFYTKAISPDDLHSMWLKDGQDLVDEGFEMGLDKKDHTDADDADELEEESNRNCLHKNLRFVYAQIVSGRLRPRLMLIWTILMGLIIFVTVIAYEAVASFKEFKDYLNDTSVIMQQQAVSATYLADLLAINPMDWLSTTSTMSRTAFQDSVNLSSDTFFGLVEDNADNNKYPIGRAFQSRIPLLYSPNCLHVDGSVSLPAFVPTAPSRCYATRAYEYPEASRTESGLLTAEIDWFNTALSLEMYYDELIAVSPTPVASTRTDSLSSYWFLADSLQFDINDGLQRLRVSFIDQARDEVVHQWKRQAPIMVACVVVVAFAIFLVASSISSQTEELQMTISLLRILPVRTTQDNRILEHLFNIKQDEDEDFMAAG